ncbi:helix-turn-helix domain-containing protein [Burkholderia pyrrocinia]
MADQLPVQGELFRAETGWFHVFRSFVDSGALADMDGATLKVYLVIKTHTNIYTGIAGPIGHKTIASKSGLHQSSVKRAIKELESLGYLSKSPCGRSTEYRFKEKWRVQDKDGRQTAIASWGYVPSQVKLTADELQAALLAGREPSGTIHIDRLQVNINHVASGAVVINVQEGEQAEGVDNIPYPQLRSALHALRTNLANRANIPMETPAQSYTQIMDGRDQE